MKDQRWLNFASTAERMAAAYERNIAGRGQSAPVSSGKRIESKGYDQIATTQEKKAAEAGGVSGGGGSQRDRCKKGKSCGAACIYYRKDCILELPETVQEPLMKMREMIKEQVAKGNLSDDEAGALFQKRLGMTDEIKWGRTDLTSPKQAKNIAKAAADMKKEAEKIDKAAAAVRKESKSEEEYKQKMERIHGLIYGGLGALKREKISEITPEGVEFAQRNKAVFLEGDKIMAKAEKDLKAGTLTAQQMNERLEPIAAALKPMRGQFTDAEINYATRLLSTYEATYLGKAGSLTSGGGLFEKGQSTPSGYGNLSKASAEQQEARRYLGVKAFLEQGGRDAYTGQRIPILRMDWEHFIPFEAANKFAEVENNFFLTSSRVNGGKAAQAPSYVINTSSGLPKKMQFDDKGRMTAESRVKWARQEADKLALQSLKKAGFENAFYQAGFSALRDLTGSTMFSSLPADGKLAVMNKIVYGGLASLLPSLAETAGGGIQSSGRGDKRWYYYGKENADFAKTVFKKYMQLLEKDDQAGLMQLANILRNYGDNLNPMITARIPSNDVIVNEKTGARRPIVRIGEEVTPQVRQIINELNQISLDQINTL